jgi:hypothetical protein
VRFHLSLLVCSLLIYAAPVRADLIVNGSFENPVVPNGQQQSVSGSFSGWTVVSDPVQFFNTNYVESNIRFNAQSGNQAIDVSGYTNTMSDGIQQTVATSIGQRYELSFYVGRADHFDPGAATVDLSIDGGSRFHYTNTGPTSRDINWEQFTVDFTATQSSTSLAFLNGTPIASGVVAGLDNVTLTAITPEPSTLVISSALLGILGVVGLARKPRKRTTPSR